MPSILLRRQEVCVLEVMFELFDFDVHEAGFSKHFEGDFLPPRMATSPVPPTASDKVIHCMEDMV